MPGGALALLRRRPQFRALWGALALSYTGSGAAIVALTLYVQQTHDTGTAVAALLVAESAPQLLGPLVGGIADRVDLRRLMIGADLVQAAAFALIALLPPLPLLIALAALTATMQTAYRPARTAAIPALVAEEELLTANALTGIASNLYVALGPLVGGVLFALGDTSLAMLVNTVTFLASAQLTRAVPPLRAESQDGGHEPLLAATRTGLRYATRDPLTRTVLLSLFAIFAFVAIDNVALVFLVRDTLGGGGVAYGVVSAAFGVGMLAASLTIARGTSIVPSVLFLVSLVLTSAGALLTALAPSVAVVGLVLLVSGAGNGIEIVASETILHQRVPRRMLGRIAGLMATATSAGMAVAMAFGGFLVDATSPRTAFFVAAAGSFLITACASPSLIRARSQPSVRRL
jgi:MFS family permease